MFCIKCGTAIPDESTICPACGAAPREDTHDDPAVVYCSSSSEPECQELRSVKKRKVHPGIIYTTVGIVCIAVVILVVNLVSTANLKKQLVKEWYATDDKIIQVLDISNDEIEYKLVTGYAWMDMTLGNYKWKAISGDKIKINMFGDDYETFAVKISDDGNALTVTPAITSVDSSETWVHVDF